MSYKDIGDLIADLNKLPEAFDQLLRAITIDFTFLVVPRLMEVFFSVMKRVKTYL